MDRNENNRRYEGACLVYLFFLCASVLGTNETNKMNSTWIF